MTFTGYTASDWLWLSDRRHADGGQLAGHRLHRRVQILQVPQIQAAAANQPRPQVPGSASKPRPLRMYITTVDLMCVCVCGGYPVERFTDSDPPLLLFVSSRLDGDGIELLLAFLRVSLSFLHNTQNAVHSKLICLALFHTPSGLKGVSCVAVFSRSWSYFKSRRLLLVSPMLLLITYKHTVCFLFLRIWN